METQTKNLISKSGTVTKLIKPCFYGFIQRDNVPGDNPGDIFFHGSATICEFNNLVEGMRVAYLESVDKQGRPRAIGVVVE